MSSLGQILSSRANRGRSLYGRDPEQRRFPNGPTAVSQHPPVPALGEYSDWLRSAAGPLGNPTLLQPPANGFALFLLRFGKPAQPAITSFPTGPQYLITGWLTPNWVRFATSLCRRGSVPSAPHSSRASLLTQLELTRNWLRFAISWLPPPLGP